MNISVFSIATLFFVLFLSNSSAIVLENSSGIPITAPDFQIPQLFKVIFLLVSRETRLFGQNMAIYVKNMIN